MKALSTKGYTLFELGVVMAMAGILALAVYSTAQTRFANARRSRTLSDMDLLLQHSEYAFRRGMAKAPNGDILFLFDDAQPAATLNVNTPLCFDLSNINNQVAVPSWCDAAPTFNGSPIDSMTFQAVPSSGPLVQATTGDGLTLNNSYLNPYCLPYFLCIFRNRREILTCLPKSQASGLDNSVVSCGACNHAGNMDCIRKAAPNPTAVVSEESALIPQDYAPNTQPVF